jgi:hypothetical protein
MTLVTRGGRLLGRLVQLLTPTHGVCKGGCWAMAIGPITTTCAARIARANGCTMGPTVEHHDPTTCGGRCIGSDGEACKCSGWGRSVCGVGYDAVGSAGIYVSGIEEILLAFILLPGEVVNKLLTVFLDLRNVRPAVGGQCVNSCLFKHGVGELHQGDVSDGLLVANLRMVRSRVQRTEFGSSTFQAVWILLRLASSWLRVIVPLRLNR